MSADTKEKDFKDSLQDMDYLSELFNGKASQPAVVQETATQPKPAAAPVHKKPKEKKTRRAYLLMKPSLYNEVMKKAKRDETSLNQIVEDALEFYLCQEK